MKLNFTKLNGFVPAIIQDFETREVLMLGFMNPEAFEKTQQTGFVWFWSRTKKRLWMKGETSGNKLLVKNMLIDCDQDSLLIQVEAQGDQKVCHTGRIGCFNASLRGVRNRVTMKLNSL